MKTQKIKIVLCHILFIFLLVGCRKGIKQIIEIENKSENNIYFLISKDSIIKDNNTIKMIRPRTLASFLEQEKRVNHLENKADSLIRLKNYMYPYRIEPNNSKIILSSESTEMFINTISIKEIIKNQYNNKANVFIIKERDLNLYSDKEIINEKKYEIFLSLTDKEIIKDTLLFKYFTKK